MNKGAPSAVTASAQRHHVLAATTYRNNLASNYTERIEQLESAFVYDEHRHHYWGPEELSLFYGTALHDQASPAQKLALNHLYWVTQYNQTAATEANAVLYNQVTEGVFSSIGGFDVLCKMLLLETEQEHHHMHAFHAVGHATRKQLLGPRSSVVPNSLKTRKKSPRAHRTSSVGLGSFAALPRFDWTTLESSALRLVSCGVSSGSGVTAYSSYLRTLSERGQSIPIQTTGLLGHVVPRPLSRWFTANIGSSPFSACFFYATRYLANLLLKNWEHRYFQHYKTLEQQQGFVPAPTAISYFHMMDESFHTTTSQLIAQDLYKEFARPTAYESLMANLMFYQGQKIMLSGLSGAMPSTFRRDGTFLRPLYQILRSPIFEFSDAEAIHWLEQSICQENGGYQANLQHHDRLIKAMRQAFEPLDYLWPVNRHLTRMAARTSIGESLATNRIDLERFRQSLGS